MTFTHSSTRFVATVAGVAVASALLVGALAVATPAKAQSALTSTQVSAIISLLQSFGASAEVIANVQASLTGGTPSTGGGTTTGGSSSAACYAWTRSLTVGSSGADVKALQVFLNSTGTVVAPAGSAGSPGMETMTFGPATRAAVASFQTAKGISPAAGYFGPVTRAAVAAMCGTTPGTPGTPTTPGTLQGGEGSLDVNGELGDVEDEVEEGEDDVQVFGLELEADDSDIMIERVDVEIDMDDATTGESSNVDDYIEEVTLWLDGKKIGTLDADEGDEDSDDLFSFRFSGLTGVIKEGEEAELYVAVTGVDNIDSGDTAVVLEVGIPADGIRAVDAAGISETYDGGYTGNGGGDLSSFSVVEAEGGDLDLAEGDDNPEDMVAMVDEDDDTDDVLLLEFELEANDSGVIVDSIPVGLTSVTSEVDGIATRVMLTRDGDVIDTVSIPSSATTFYLALFDDLDEEIEDGDTAVFQVLADLNNVDVSSPHTFATGSTMYATTTASDSNWDVEDDNGDTVTPDGGTVTGGTLTFETDGITATFVSSSESRTTTADTTGESDVGEFKIVFDVTAMEEDIYLDRSVTPDPDRGGTGSAGDGFIWATTTDSTNVGTPTGILSDTISASDADSDDTTDLYKIDSGQTRRFTLTVNLSANGADGSAAVELTGINWTTNSGITAAEWYNSNLDEFKTDLLFLQSI